MGKRLKMSRADYQEMVTARDWCKRHDYTGMAAWYDEHLVIEARRKALPHDAPESRAASEEERDRRGGRH